MRVVCASNQRRPSCPIDAEELISAKVPGVQIANTGEPGGATVRVGVRDAEGDIGSAVELFADVDPGHTTVLTEVGLRLDPAAVSVAALFGTSALYHRITWASQKARRWMRRLDRGRAGVELLPRAFVDAISDRAAVGGRLDERLAHARAMPGNMNRTRRDHQLAGRRRRAEGPRRDGRRRPARSGRIGTT